MEREPLDIGFPTTWEQFAAGHSAFLETYPRTMALMQEALNRIHVKDWPSRIILFLSLQAIEDFNEIVLLCAHGFGIGALKILRGMYERVVTQRYLSEHTDEVQAFLDYYHVNRRKMFGRAIEVFGRSFSRAISKESLEAIETNYQELDPEWRKQKSWTKIDLPTLAKKATGKLEDLYLHCFLIPTLVAHATQSSILDRLEVAEK